MHDVPIDRPNYIERFFKAGVKHTYGQSLKYFNAVWTCTKCKRKFIYKGEISRSECKGGK